MNYLSVCSGIEAATVAWHRLGWAPIGFAEIEPFPAAVLQHRYPTVPNFGDMTKLHEYLDLGIFDAPDILVGGTPCQAFSVAGLRRSLDDARGNLSLTYCDLANAIDHRRAREGKPPVITVWENVPGVLSTHDNAFGCFLAGLAGESEPLVPAGKRWSDAGLVYGPQRAVAWRILDAQYFGVAQRRRRVFVVASARTDFDPAAVFLECEGVRRDSAPSRETGEATAGTRASRTEGGGFPGTDEACSGYVQPVVGALTARGGRNGGQSNDDVFGNKLICMAHGQGGAEIGFDCGPTLTCNHEAPIAAYAFAENSRAEIRLEGGDGSRTGALSTGGGKMGQGVPAIAVGFNARQDPDHWQERSGPLDTDGGTQAVAYRMQVRRLTPVECERLQGFPDNYTRIPWRKKPAAECPDGPRYKALGNSMAVPCMHWIGRRIAKALP